MKNHNKRISSVIKFIMIASLASACSGQGPVPAPTTTIPTVETSKLTIAFFDEASIIPDTFEGLDVFSGTGSVPNDQGETLLIVATGTSSDYVIEYFKTAKFYFEIRENPNPPSVNVKPIQPIKFSVSDALKADKSNLLIKLDVPPAIKEKYPKGTVFIEIDPVLGQNQQHIYLPTDPLTNQVDVEMTSQQGMVEGDLYLENVGLMDAKKTSGPNIPEMVSAAGDGIFDFVITGLEPGNNEYQLRGTWSYGLTDTAPAEPIPALVISQTEGEASAWFGQGNEYVNVGQGQSFVVHQTATIKEFSIYLEAVLGNTDTDKIICDLRNADMVVLQSSSTSGFSSGEGWISLYFDITVNPGTYIFTCYLDNSNTLENHTYSIHGNGDDNSYLEGTRYDSVGGHPVDGSTWSPIGWDLKFVIKMEPLP